VVKHEYENICRGFSGNMFHRKHNRSLPRHTLLPPHPHHQQKPPHPNPHQPTPPPHQTIQPITPSQNQQNHTKQSPYMSIVFLGMAIIVLEMNYIINLNNLTIIMLVSMIGKIISVTLLGGVLCLVCMHQLHLSN